MMAHKGSGFSLLYSTMFYLYSTTLKCRSRHNKMVHHGNTTWRLLRWRGRKHDINPVSGQVDPSCMSGIGQPTCMRVIFHELKLQIADIPCLLIIIIFTILHSGCLISPPK